MNFYWNVEAKINQNLFEYSKNISPLQRKKHIESPNDFKNIIIWMMSLYFCMLNCRTFGSLLEFRLIRT